MKKRCFTLFLIAAVSLGVLGRLPAQAAPDSTTLSAMVKLRGDMTSAVVKGDEKAPAAIARLKQQDSPSGLKLDHDADFAFAAIDVGQRLIAAGKPAEAEPFFQEAEKSLTVAVKKTPDADAGNKAMLLQTLANIRSNFLNNAAQAWADLDSAVKLQPDDKFLRESRDRLSQENPEVAKSKANN